MTDSSNQNYSYTEDYFRSEVGRRLNDLKALFEGETLSPQTLAEVDTAVVSLMSWVNSAWPSLKWDIKLSVSDKAAGQYEVTVISSPKPAFVPNQGDEDNDL